MKITETDAKAWIESIIDQAAINKQRAEKAEDALTDLAAQLKQANAACADMNAKYSKAMTRLAHYEKVTA